MNKQFHWILTSLFALFINVTFAGITPEPTDSSTNVVDKSAAIYLIEEGKTLYGKFKIKEALIKFRQAHIKDPNSWKSVFWISNCHYRLNNYGYALNYAKEAVKLSGDKVNDEIYFRLAESYHRLGYVDSALVNYKLANENLPKIRSNELLVDLHISECEFALKEMKGEPKFGRTRLEGDINSGYDDYGAIFLEDSNKIYFISRRSNTTGGGMNPDDETYFEDVYVSTWDNDFEQWGNISNNLGKINSDGFDALNYISPDGLYGIMTLNTTATDMSKVTRGSDLCELRMSSKGTWNSPKIINNKSINTSFFEGAATVTKDGNTMYFVTDRKAEKSGSDIYVVHRNGKSWGDAKPLPMAINTKGHETTPYISTDGRYLFFSSNGHTGLGGYDVYVVEVLGNDEYGKPINLGAGVNTVNNDTHFSYYEKSKMALMSGFEIIGNKASIDIYKIDMESFEFPRQ